MELCNFSFLALSRSYYICTWNAERVNFLSVPFCTLLVAGLRETSEDLKLARGCLPLAPFFKTPQFYGVCRASTRSNAAADQIGQRHCLCPNWSSQLSNLVFRVQFPSNLLEPQRAAQGVGFRGPFWGPEEATMAGQPFQQHLKGRSVQELLCHGEAPDLVL